MVKAVFLPSFLPTFLHNVFICHKPKIAGDMLLSQFSKFSRNISKASLVLSRIDYLIGEISSTKNVVDQSTIEISQSANISSFIHSIILFEVAYYHVLQNRISIYMKKQKKKKRWGILQKIWIIAITKEEIKNLN